MKVRRLQRGDIVRDCYGKTHEVMHQIGTTVYMFDGMWFHRTKVFYG